MKHSPLLFILILVACHTSEKHSDAHHHDAHHHDILFTTEQALAAGLEIETVTPQPFCSVIKVGGEIRLPGAGEASITAPENGIVNINKKAISEGARVAAGEALFTVSASTMHEVAPLVQAQSEYEAAKKAYQRAENLVKDRIISASEFEQTALRYETAKTLYETHTANLTPGGVQIKSPVNGYIKSISAAQGEYVTAGQTLAVIAQSRRLQLRAEAPEVLFHALQKVNDANFRLSYSPQLFKLSRMNGRLLAVGQSGNDASYFIPITFEFDNIGDILPGVFAEVFLLTKSPDNVITVPLTALTEEQGLFFVYIREDDDGYRKQEVKTGMNDGERIEILKGLTAGEQVVTKGVYQVKLAALSGIIPEGHSHNH